MADRRIEIVKAVLVTAEVIGTHLSEAAVTVMVERLASYDPALVLAALERCQLDLRGPLTLGAIMDRLDDGHLGPEAAWALVGELKEDQTVVWTDEIAGAWQASRGLRRDEVARRMAFLEDYRKRLAEARYAKRRGIWWASLGQDPTQRAGALLAAMEQGRLPAGRLRALLPPHQWPATLQPALPPAAEDHRAHLRALIGGLATPADGGTP